MVYAFALRCNENESCAEYYPSTSFLQVFSTQLCDQRLILFRNKGPFSSRVLQFSQRLGSISYPELFASEFPPGWAAGWHCPSPTPKPQLQQLLSGSPSNRDSHSSCLINYLPASSGAEVLDVHCYANPKMLHRPLLTSFTLSILV